MPKTIRTSTVHGGQVSNSYALASTVPAGYAKLENMHSPRPLHLENR